MDRGSIGTWRNGKLHMIVDEIEDERESRFNDVFADSQGRVFCGTMPTKDGPGRLYRLDRNGGIHKKRRAGGTVYRHCFPKRGCPNRLGRKLRQLLERSANQGGRITKI